ncbi:hypothetical protein RUMHYD_02732 [Blautia hydrogenotrophica DSM 10507]|uniref:Uncharacterized protein n=1 Tax=Blautia hydrogenotrophica (strain DSM 10507 / JCM 14656 / S5a33) TaxID=476272 RepID=C0CPD2_BLAHS|nr:hypothetical protein RUMHYD_02732 [Blautia hydrogenotrophica DSM 10507]
MVRIRFKKSAGKFNLIKISSLYPFCDRNRLQYSKEFRQMQEKLIDKIILYDI